MVKIIIVKMEEIIQIGKKLIEMNEKHELPPPSPPPVDDFKNYLSLLQAGERYKTSPKQMKLWCDEKLITSIGVGSTTYLNPITLADEVRGGKLDKRKKK